MANYDIKVTSDLSGLQSSLVDVADSMGMVAQTVSNVTNYVSMVDSKVGNVTSEVTSLREKIDDFMMKMEGTTAVTNAKQSLVLANQELDKKFRYYEVVRKQTTGVLQAVDLKSISKESLMKMAEEVVLKTPNYWLGRSFIALTAWINNDKNLAERALNDSLRLDDENTSLLFFLVHMRLNRINSALVWFNRYLTMQDPMKMDLKIVNVINSMISGIYGLDAKKLLLSNISKWILELNSKAGIKEENVQYYVDFLNRRRESVEVDSNKYPYLASGPSWVMIKNALVNANLNHDLLEYFIDIFNQKEAVIPKRVEQIDLMLEDLLTNYDKDEYIIRKEILKNKIIVEENGDLKKAYKRLDTEMQSLDGNQNFYQYLNDIALYPAKYDCLLSTRKFAIALNKSNILEALSKNEEIKKNLSIKLKIVDWEGLTSDGSNDRQLRQSLFSHIDTTFHDEVYKYRYLTTKVIIGIVLILLGIVGGVMLSPLVFLGSVVGFIIALLDCKNVYEIRASQQKKINELKKYANIILNNNIAEVIDLQRELDKGIEEQKKLLAFIDSLNVDQFILKTSDDDHRKVIIGE